ncbi:hypothetical protein B0H11DRAFT_2191282 [Mycena galericulata]|nr:hypothetical protein B0H11DRAFT_2191282 [Mycena galericulata]
MAQRIDDAGPEARVVCGGQQHRIPWHQLWWRRLPASFQPPTSPELDGVKGRQSRWRVSDSSALTRVVPPIERPSAVRGVWPDSGDAVSWAWPELESKSELKDIWDKRGNDQSKTHQGRGRGHLNGTGAQCKGAGGSRDNLRKDFQRRLGIASSAEIVSWRKRGTGEERAPSAGVGSRSDTMKRETMWILALVEANSNMEMVHQLPTKISLDTMFRVSTREGRAGESLPCRPVEAHTGPLTGWTQRSLSGAGIVPMSTRRGAHWASNEVDTSLNGARIVPPRRPVEAHTGPLMGCTAFMCPIPGMAMQNTSRVGHQGRDYSDARRDPGPRRGLREALSSGEMGRSRLISTDNPDALEGTGNGPAEVKAIRVLCRDEDLEAWEALSMRLTFSDAGAAKRFLSAGAFLFGTHCRVSRYSPRPRRRPS